MKAHLKTLGGRLMVELEAEDIKGLFREIAAAQEILDSDSECGCCQSNALRFNVRQAESFSFYELRCSNCHAALSYGQRKDGGLFAKRRDEDGNWMENRGWKVYQP